MAYAADAGCQEIDGEDERRGGEEDSEDDDEDDMDYLLDDPGVGLDRVLFPAI